MKATLVVSAAIVVATLMLSACTGGPGDSASGDVEKYRRDHDRYMRTHEPKTGGPDL
jgi:hypothetical protein